MSDETPTSPLGLAFLGCGRITGLHSGTLRHDAPEVRRFYASRRPGAAAAANRRFHGSGWFNSYEAALTHDDIDVVLVATPPGTHLELALAALAAGRHVIVEKPAFLQVEDCDIAAAAAQQAGRQLLVAENYFYKPLAERLRGVIGSGVLGDVRLVQVNALKQQSARGWRAHAELAGGGSLFEGGIHWIDLLAHLGLTVTGVAGFKPGTGDEPDRSAVVVLEYREGALGVLSYSWEVASPLHGVRISRIYGTRGSVAFESNGLFLLALAGARPVRLALPGLTDLAGYRAMFRDFLRALRTGEAARFTLAHARLDIALARAASARCAGLSAGTGPAPES
jgi:UDP-N-acetylglucosamine 3-dehydrogenase